MSLLEILVAIIVLGLALLPIVFMTSTTAGRTVSMEHHVVASHFAAGLMDRYLTLDFEECRRTIAGEVFPQNILTHDVLLNPQTGSVADAELTRTFKGFKVSVTMEEPASKEREQMFTLVVKVTWPAPGRTAADRSLVLRAVKFNENP